MRAVVCSDSGTYRSRKRVYPSGLVHAHVHRITHNYSHKMYTWDNLDPCEKSKNFSFFPPSVPMGWQSYYNVSTDSQALKKIARFLFYKRSVININDRNELTYIVALFLLQL